MIVIRHEDGRFFSSPGYLSWFTEEVTKIKVYGSRESPAFLKDMKDLGRMKMYNDKVIVEDVTHEAAPYLSRLKIY